VTSLLDGFVESLSRVELYVKILFLLVTLPIWRPILRAMWEELNVALGPEGGLYGRTRIREIPRRPPGMDPFVNVPLAGRRAEQGFARRAERGRTRPSRPGTFGPRRP